MEPWVPYPATHKLGVSCLKSQHSEDEKRDNGQNFKVILSYTVVTFRAARGSVSGVGR